MHTSALKLIPRDDYVQPFVYDVIKLRSRTKTTLAQSSTASASYHDRTDTMDVLQAVLATEIVCMLRYTLNAISAAQLSNEAVKKEFIQHAKDAHSYIDAIAERILQLGGKPDFNPRNLATREDSESIEDANMTDMIRENLVAERIACEHYRELIRFFAKRDPSTQKVLETILVRKEEYVIDMYDLLVAKRETAMLS